MTFRRVAVSLRGPGQSPVLPFACCVGSLLSVSRCGRCSCWCRFRVCGAQWSVCRGCAECGGMCRLRVSGAQWFGVPRLWWLLAPPSPRPPVQERRRFGPLGWNEPCEFSEADLRISVFQLREHVDKYDDLPLDALLYLTGHCNYGGRVTDDHDRRCLLSLLSVYYCPELLSEGYAFTPSGVYRAPRPGPHHSYVQHIQALPVEQEPEIFGLHANADITKGERDAKVFLEAALATQPQSAGPGPEGCASDVARASAEGILGSLPDPFDLEAAAKAWPTVYEESMNTVLQQEMGRFNRLSEEIRASLSDMVKAIRGEVVLSPALENVFDSVVMGRIPPLWLSKSYPSVKPLGAYIADLVQRLQFFAAWDAGGPPAVFWLSGFFFPQSFLTGVLQNHARKHRTEIDILKWSFAVMDSQETHSPSSGCYVSGLYLEGAGWDGTKKQLCESATGHRPLLSGWLILYRGGGGGGGSEAKKKFVYLKLTSKFPL